MTRKSQGRVETHQPTSWTDRPLCFCSRSSSCGGHRGLGPQKVQLFSFLVMCQLLTRSVFNFFKNESYCFPACQERCLEKEFLSITCDEKEVSIPSSQGTANDHLLSVPYPLQGNLTTICFLILSPLQGNLTTMITVSVSAAPSEDVYIENIETSCLIKKIPWEPELLEVVKWAKSF